MSNEAISKLYQVNELVIAVGQTQLQGDITPHEWYSKITHENGKPDPVAVALLAHIVYWYRPIELLEHARPVWYKKFSSDLLQKSYKDLQEHFGFTRRQLHYAFLTLERLKLAQRILRTIFVGTQKISNVMFIEIFPKAVAEISQPVHKLKKKVPYYDSCQEGGLLTSMSIGPDNYVKTNTETTTETTKSLVSDLPIPPHFGYGQTTRKKRSGKSLRSKKEEISLKDPIEKNKIRFKLSDQQIDILNWLVRIRAEHRWDGYDEDGNPIMDDSFVMWMATKYHKDALLKAISITVDTKPDSPGAFIRTVLKNESISEFDPRSRNFNFLKTFKDENNWDELQLGNKSAWYLENGTKEKIDLTIDPEQFTLFVKMRFNQFKRHSHVA